MKPTPLPESVYGDGLLDPLPDGKPRPVRYIAPRMGKPFAYGILGLLFGGFVLSFGLQRSLAGSTNERIDAAMIQQQHLAALNYAAADEARNAANMALDAAIKAIERSKEAQEELAAYKRKHGE